MRILILNWRDLANPRAGGAEVYTEGFAQVLAKRGHDVTLFASSFDGAAARDEGDITIVRRGSRLSVYREAKRFLRESEGAFDVIIDEVNTRPFFAHRWTDTPSVALIHQVAREVWFYEMPYPIAVVGRFLLEPLWLRSYRGRTVMTDSPSSAESLRLYGVEGAIPLPIGALPVQEAPRVVKAQQTAIFVARMVKSKRPDHVIKAFEIVRREIPSAQLWMVGDGPWKKHVQALAGDGVEFLGRVSSERRNELMASASVLLMTSVREGWGLTVSEASVLGTPAIGYTSPGLVDSIPASGGILTEQRPEALAQAIIEVFSGRRTIVANPHIVTWDSVADAVEKVLHSAMSQH
jgi:glycosyltransferase involved in cell wall biosynthesis